MTPKLQKLFLVAIPLFVAHGLEEIFTGFALVNSHVTFVFGWLTALPTMQAVFTTFQVTIWLLLIVAYLLILGSRWQIRVMTVLGIIFVYELHHVYEAVAVGGYAPGLITAFALYAIGFFFWRELIKHYRNVAYAS
ncbi:HXXEE domain-containing protein [Candidatus Kaiserbacteria bacterium]|nr:HXXEE domain-containing protein [Candidatus Kaiserbacteria bacterium]